MKLNFNSNTSFKSIPIYDVKVKQKVNGEEKFVDATFSCITPLDIFSLRKMPAEWVDEPYTLDIIRDLENEPSVQFYAVELNGDESLEDRILSLAEVNNGYITYLQSGPKSLQYKNYTGAGTMMLYGLAKRSDEQQSYSLHWLADEKSYNFYKHVGDDLFYVAENLFALPRANYKAFLADVEEKYQLDVDA